MGTCLSVQPKDKTLRRMHDLDDPNKNFKCFHRSYSYTRLNESAINAIDDLISSAERAKCKVTKKSNSFKLPKDKMKIGIAEV